MSVERYRLFAWVLNPYITSKPFWVVSNLKHYTVSRSDYRCSFTGGDVEPIMKMTFPRDRMKPILETGGVVIIDTVFWLFALVYGANRQDERSFSNLLQLVDHRFIDFTNLLFQGWD